MAFEEGRVPMPRIFDNIEKSLLPALRETLGIAERADFCVGYFNLRGWRNLAEHIDRWPGNEEHCCRFLIGMPVTPFDEMRLMLKADDISLDNQTAQRERRRVAEDFRRQLTAGVPTNADEAVLRQLSTQIRSHKLLIKVYLQHSLHARLTRSGSY